MISFYDLSDTVRGIFCVWTLMIYILELWNFLHSLRQKRKWYIAISAMLLFLIYLAIQAIFDIKHWHEGERGISVTFTLGQLPAVWWILFIFFCMTVSISMFLYFARWKKAHITVMSVKDSMDMLQAGVCYWKKGGQIILSNHKMDELCLAITGNILLNGEQFFQEIREECIAMPDGTIRSFRHRVVDFYGEQIHEMVATDVTEIYKKNEMLARETEALRKMNESLCRYNLEIEEIVRMQEILQAKMYIHDEMNRLMLLTSVNTDMPVKGENFNSIMTVWRNNALLLGNEAVHQKSDTDIIKINQLSELLGIKVSWSGESLQEVSEKNREILIVAAREALANAIKHAEATELIIDIRIIDTKVVIIISNDGNIPVGEISEGGGISNIRRMVEEAEGKFKYQLGEQFSIQIELPVEVL